MVDRFVYGEVSRVSPEAPIPVLARSRETDDAGRRRQRGAQRRRASADGAALVGVIGGDAGGRRGAAPGGRRARASRAIWSPTAEPADHAQDPLRLRRPAAAARGRRGRRAGRPARSSRSWCAPSEHAAEGAGVILLSDYGKGVVTPAVIAACREAARTLRRASWSWIPRPRSFARYGAVDLIKPNAAELALRDRPADRDRRGGRGGAGAGAGALRGQGDPGDPRRPRACRWRCAASRCATSAASPREVFDASGAGDTRWRRWAWRWRPRRRSRRPWPSPCWPPAWRWPRSAPPR